MRLRLHFPAARMIRLAFTAALALEASCSPAFAQDHETWRCDAPNASYDVNSPPIWDKTTSISGEINFHKADFGPGYGSIARIAFEDSKLDNSDCHCNGLFMKGFENGAVGLYMLVDGQPEMFPIGGTFDYPIPFKISIDPNGVMTVQVGEKHVQTKTAMLPNSRRDTLLMSCSGADVSFLNVNPQ